MFVCVATSVSELSDVYRAKWYFGLCCKKLQGCLVMHSLQFCLSPIPSKFSLFPLTGSDLAILHVSNYSNGPQQLFSPTPAPPVWLPHSSKPDLLLGLSGPCLGDMRCCVSVASSPAEWESNVPETFPQPLVPFQHLQRAAFSHAGNLRRPRGHHLGFPQLQLLPDTLLHTWVYVMPCLGSNMHPRPWFHCSSLSCNVSFCFYFGEQHFALEILKTANMF